MLQREARRVGMVPVYGSSGGHASAHTLAPRRNRQGSMSPAHGASFDNRECIYPPIGRPSSSPHIDASSSLLVRFRTPTLRAESARPEIALACIDDDDSAHAEVEKAMKALGPVDYQSQDKSRLPSCAGSHRPFATPDRGSASAIGKVAGEEARKPVETQRTLSDRGNDHRGLDLLVDALERPNEAGC